MQLIQYIDQLRSILETLIKTENAIQDSNLLSQARAAIDNTTDYQSFAIDRSTLIQHMQWLEENFEGETEALAIQNLRQLLGVKRHQITCIDGELHLDDELLFVRGPEGDVLTIDADRPHIPTLIQALYDEYQCSDTILAGDDFMLNGKVIAKCVDVHVVSTEGFCSVVLTNYNWDKAELAAVCKKYQVEVVDESGAPHFVVYKGKRTSLVKLIKDFWDEYFESDYEMHEAINEHPFLCTWGEGYANPTTKLEGVSFFVDSNGYDEDDVARIQALQPGETIELLESGVHIINRLY